MSDLTNPWGAAPGGKSPFRKVEWGDAAAPEGLPEAVPADTPVPEAPWPAPATGPVGDDAAAWAPPVPPAPVPEPATTIPQTPAPAAPGPGSAVDGLDDLFEASPDPSVADLTSPPFGAGGLEDLFDAPATPAGAVPDVPGFADAPDAAQPAPAPEAATWVAPDSTPAPAHQPGAQTWPTTAPPPVAHTPPPGSAWAPPTAPPAPPAPSAPPPGPPAAPRTKIEEARQRANQGQLGDRSAELIAEEAAARAAASRYANAEHLNPMVTRLLGLVQSDHQLQALNKNFELTRDHSKDRVQRQDLESALKPKMMAADVPLANPQDMPVIFDMVYDELLGISVLGEFWRDDEVTEILVDGWNNINVERNGMLISTPAKFRDPEHANAIARALAAKVSDRALTPTNPLVTAELPGARVTFAIGSIVKSGLSTSLRKFKPLMGMEKLLSYGSLNEEMAEFLRDCVLARANIMISGGTGTGKTTQINALSQFIPDNERVVTIEDSYELQLSNKHWVAMQTKERASADDTVSITQELLLRNAMRMRPDRIIVGEIRDAAGCTVMLGAANTGHDGTMATVHANSPDKALNFRMAGWVRTGAAMTNDVAVAEVASAVNVVVQVTRRHGRRFLSEIAVVDPDMVEGGVIVPEPIFTGHCDTDGTLVYRRAGVVRPDTELGLKLSDAGIDLTRWAAPEA